MDRALIWETIEVETIVEGHALERRLIQDNKNNPKIANQIGVTGHTEETKNKISQAHIGIGHTAETRQRLSEAHKGVAKSPEHCKAISDGRIGISFTDSHREALSVSAIGRMRTSESIQKSAEGNMKKVMIGDTTYKSIGDAATANKVSFKTVARRIRSRDVKWNHWKYVTSS
jgi:hypothetical protein